MQSLKQLHCLFISVICLLVAGCSLGNLFSSYRGKPGSEEDNLRKEEILTISYRVQIGMFNTMDEAKTFAESARAKTEYPVYLAYKPPFYRVRVGDFNRKGDAEKCVQILRQKGFRDARYVFKQMDSENP